jgi:hypothetical protein
MVVRKQQKQGTTAMTKFLLSLLTGVTIAACSSDSNAPVATDASSGEATLGNTTIDGSADVEASNAPNGIVVLHTDYQSASVSFLDRDGNLLKDGCFTSGSGGQGLSLALSGDVALPTALPLGGPVVVLDRHNAALTWLDPTTCAPLRQLAVGTGFASNPHDFVWLSANKAYVTRYGENAAATPTPDDFDDGSDLLIIDPSQPKILGRIDLKPFAPAGTGILPRADRALLAGGMVYVSLNAINGNWSSYGVGRILIVDPTTDEVVGTIDTPGVKNCGAMNYLAAEKKLLVTCGGDRTAPQQADSSAIVVIDLAATPAAIIAQVSAAAAGGASYSLWALAALDGNTVLGVTEGEFSNSPPDRLWSLSLSGGASAEVFASAEAYAIGAILVDAEKGHFIVADGPKTSAAFLRVFDFAAGTVTASKTIKSNPSHNLPPSALTWY